ncbi:acyltransferase family protein [Salsuginibacillus kocurii]|uniref:acyltransferase family protein n=1 Tax=Salsuginibacillus kocurii TaxID=427078 RepID=UPI00036E05CF|nr:acyltransferase family protein [Salsuginibacillus kocurii]
MKSQSIIYELFWVRAIACLAVVLVHSVFVTLEQSMISMSQLEEYILIALRFIAFFGTPAFVFISEVLLARAYPNGVPNDFFKKRIHFLLYPYIFIGILFAAGQAGSFQQFTTEALINVFLGGYTGYFILIIFQFYILHVLLHKKLQRWSPWYVIPTSLLITILYLSFFHVTSPPGTWLGEYIWERGHWLPFFGWVFYFVVGYYVGKDYERVKAWIIRRRKAWFILTPATLLLILLSVRFDILTVVSSKRIDNIFFTVSIIFLMIWLASRFNHVPRAIMFISKYSFNIYLLHNLLLLFFPAMPWLNPFVYMGLAYLYALVGAIFIAKALEPFQWSNYLIGKVLPDPREKVSTGPSSVNTHNTATGLEEKG